MYSGKTTIRMLIVFFFFFFFVFFCFIFFLLLLLEMLPFIHSFFTGNFNFKLACRGILCFQDLLRLFKFSYVASRYP